MSDLTFIADGNPGMIGRRTNFIKYKYMHGVISTILAYQEPYNLDVVSNILDFIMSRPLLDDKEIFERSLQIEPRSADRASIQ